VDSDVSGGSIYSLGVVTRDGKRRLLLVNKRDRSFAVSHPWGERWREEYVDQTTAFQLPASVKLTSDNIILNGLGVALSRCREAVRVSSVETAGLS